MQAEPVPGQSARSYDVVIVGAGFAGLYMLCKARTLGLRARVFEAGSGVGGTWYWNRYPGARCDVESVQYSYSFDEALQAEWRWTERYAAQPEILRYAEHVAQRFGLYRDITLSTRVLALTFNQEASLWHVRCDTGEEAKAIYVVLATGALSAPQRPALEGLDDFKGRVLCTATWPRERVSFKGARVAVIGTGSSGIQVIPEIAREARHLTVFQRTPNYAIPARNRPMNAAEDIRWKRDYARLRAEARKTPNAILMRRNPSTALSVSRQEREAVYETYWGYGGLEFMAAFSDLRQSREASETASEFVRRKIRQTVRDPDVAARLTPVSYPIGTKRVCVDSGYFETFNCDNVELVDLTQTPIERVTPDGIVTARSNYDADAIVFATGFDAFTGAVLRIDIKGRGAASIAAEWKGGAQSYLGIMIAKFPNLFLITGPGSPSVFGNVIAAIEQHVEFIADLLAFLRAHDVREVEASEAAQAGWQSHCAEVASRTLFSAAPSWWMGANVEGKPRTLLPYAGGFDTYGRILGEVASNGYDGLVFAAPASPVVSE